MKLYIVSSHTGDRWWHWVLWGAPESRRSRSRPLIGEGRCDTWQRAVDTGLAAMAAGPREGN